MSENKLYKIHLPSSEPTSIDDYKKQNYLLQIIPLFSLGFDGIKLGNWTDGNTSLPYIMAGSVIEFDGSLYEARKDIILIDKTEDYVAKNDRYILFERYDTEKDALIPYVYHRTFADYDFNRRGFYDTLNYIEYTTLVKYLRISMKKESGEYRSKNYWNKDNVNRLEGSDGGGSLKKYSLLYQIPGTFNFNFPMNAESVVFHIMGAGAGAGSVVAYQTSTRKGADGGKSEILIEGRSITCCYGGKGGTDSQTSMLGPMGGIGGEKGTASGRGQLRNGANGKNGSRQAGGTIASDGMGGDISNNTLAIGGDGGDALLATSYPQRVAGGGASGSCAIVEILRSELGGSNTITIVVGPGGAKSTNTGLIESAIRSHATSGQNGSVYLEYYA